MTWTKIVLDSDAPLQRKRIVFYSFCGNAIDVPFRSYSGFSTSITEHFEQNKAYFDVSLPTPLNKTTVYDAMQRCQEAAEFKSMPFVQLVGDQPVYALILEIENKNNVLFEKILTVLGGFHSACSLIRVIYRRFKWSGLEDLAVVTGMTEPGSLDDAI